tara:strand:- start:232 stop:924 length:693 start_codon:yes stop_codon:yes gene_type:complete
MKVVILAGGLGTRLSEYTKKIPKPMVTISGKPIIYYIMKHYSNYGFNNFIIAGGYKQNIIRKYFNKKFLNWNVEVINTGLNSMTGGRLKRLKKIIGNETFLLTYGDGLSDVNINKLVNFHKKTKSIATLTAVRPPARFGAIKIKGNRVSYFKEKSNLDEGWINGGFLIMNPKIFEIIRNDKTYLEREPFEILSKKKLLNAFKHNGFWQCMDTLRDKELLENYFKNKKIKF